MFSLKIIYLISLRLSVPGVVQIGSATHIKANFPQYFAAFLKHQAQSVYGFRFIGEDGFLSIPSAVKQQ